MHAYHVPVLLNESVQGLITSETGIYVDVTFGGGGHSSEILKNLTSGKLIAFDKDEDALPNMLADERFTLVNSDFRYLKNFLRLYNAIPADGILADLGVSSHQFDVAERGFSTRFDGDLDLRMDRRQDFSARDLINAYEQAKLKEIFIAYADIPQAGRLASQIVKARENKTIETTFDLKNAIVSCVPRGQENKYHAMVFQALRIEVNGELDALKDLLLQSVEVLKTGGRIAVISYHSLEDRLVKNFFKAGNFTGEQTKDLYGNIIAPLSSITRKPILASEEEIQINNRARSAKLRIAEKII